MANYGVKYRYDLLGRLTIADIDTNLYNSYDFGINTNGTEDSVTYDLNGNITRINRHGSVSNYSYLGNSNRVSYTTGAAQQYFYDGNGNIVQSTPKCPQIS